MNGSGPLPPDDLLQRIGVSPAAWPTAEQRATVFAEMGRGIYDDVVSALPGDWSWAGRRVLDFGCGSGRVLRWFAPHLADGVELVGCDIHAPTIEWMKGAYPDCRFYVNDEDPPLPEQDGTFDLVYCGSVFSHLPSWAPWLLEMRRILKPGGLLVASLHGRGFWSMGVAASRGVPWDEDATGLLVERAGDDFEDGWGPAVYVSEWWLRAHWGRALELVRYEPSGFAQPDQRDGGQAWVVARRGDDDRELSPADLTAPSDDPRELPAALRAQGLAYDEIATEHVPTIRRLVQESAALQGRLAAESAQLERHREGMAKLRNSLSWRVTAPLRRIKSR